MRKFGELLTSLIPHHPIFVQHKWLPHQPLKVGIAADLRALGIMDDGEIGLLLRTYCARFMYRRAVVVGAVRYATVSTVALPAQSLQGRPPIHISGLRCSWHDAHRNKADRV